MPKIHCKEFKYNNAADLKEKMRWGHSCRCCFRKMNEGNTSYCIDKNGWGYQECDDCLTDEHPKGYCSFYSPDMEKWFVENGYINPEMFDTNRNFRERKEKV